MSTGKSVTPILISYMAGAGATALPAPVLQKTKHHHSGHHRGHGVPGPPSSQDVWLSNTRKSREESRRPRLSAAH